ncbi:hypothetical protein U1Q18_031634 [Sarracenia purpurea var. burkii]
MPNKVNLFDKHQPNFVLTFEYESTRYNKIEKTCLIDYTGEFTTQQGWLLLLMGLHGTLVSSLGYLLSPVLVTDLFCMIWCLVCCCHGSVYGWLLLLHGLAVIVWPGHRLHIAKLKPMVMRLSDKACVFAIATAAYDTFAVRFAIAVSSCCHGASASELAGFAMVLLSRLGYSLVMEE